MKTLIILTTVILLSNQCLCSKPLHKPSKVNPKQPHADTDTDWRLPEDKVTLTSYTVDLWTHIENFNDGDFSFKGETKIVLKVNDSAPDDDELKKIILHKGSNLNITEIILTQVKCDQCTVITVTDEKQSFDNTTEKLTISLQDKLIKNIDYELFIAYDGTHSNDMYGFYPSSYTDGEQTRWLLLTQFESTFARRAFPCFDEPALKATFKVTIFLHQDLFNQGYRALSNMNLDEVEIKGDQMKFDFETSTPISPYLVAFVIADFTSTSTTLFKANESDDALQEFRTWGRKQFIDGQQGKISQIAGPATMNFMYKTLDVPYPLPKVDQVGIPDFAAGAMENMGLVTYRERLLLVDGENTAATQQAIQVTVHELAHQWFGDLVTLHWWSDIWLNEGFATYWETFAAMELGVKEWGTEDWDLEGQFLVTVLQDPAFEEDSLPGARPLTNDVDSPDQIQANFDTVSYSKGGSILRMARHILGEKLFHQGLKNYLEANLNNVGTPESLGDELQNAILTSGNNKPNLPEGKTIRDIFNNWFKNPGYPVVTATREDTNVTLTQARFYQKPPETGPKAEDKWYIPISCATDKFDDVAPTTWMTPTDKDSSITISGVDGDWFVINIQQAGYYRVNYDEQSWRDLIEVLNNQTIKIHAYNRAQLLDDAFSIAKSTSETTLNYTIALDLSEYMEKEEEYVPWVAFTNQLSFLKSKLAALANNDTTKAIYSRFRKYVLAKVEQRFDALGLDRNENSTHLEKLSRSLITSWACTLEHEGCVNAARDKYNSNDEIDADVKKTVYCSAVRKGNKDVWNKLWEKYVSTVDNSEQTLIMSALGCSKDEEVLGKYLEKTLSDSQEIRPQDRRDAFASVYNGNPENVAFAFDFLSEQLLNITASYGGLNPVGDIVMGIASKLVTQEDWVKMNGIKEMIDESSDPKLTIAGPSANAALSIISNNINWLDQKLPELEDWLKYHYNSAFNVTVNMAVLLAAIFIAVSNYI